MAVLFYDHLVDRNPIIIAIEGLDADEETKGKFRKMIDEILHHGILEKILQKLSPHKHKTFLRRLEEAPYDPELLIYLRKNVGDEIEMEIQQEGRRIIRLILRKDLGIED